ncbi:MAG TPA: DNA-3-methyladenine glycosylase 2 family protein [Clostridiales bacterium]|nr:DNA-3-methyladenine glycosylase 2 family protein [Clostridiales bacterium]
MEVNCMLSLHYDLYNEKVKYLIGTDDKLGKLIQYINETELIIEEDGFKCIVKYIIGQQISDKARETIWQRVCTIFKNVTPKKILAISDNELREIGLSERKVNYIKTLASAVISKDINFYDFRKLTNEEIIKKLTALKGIGQWTAEMYLIFSLGRENVLSKGDGTIRRTIQWMYDLEKLPSSEMLTKYFSSWSQYATIVSSYLWKSIELGLVQKPFNEIISN